MPRQKWRGISIFGMTNPFDPPQKRALGDAELAEALELAQLGEDGAIGAMELLAEQSTLRAEDAQAYVRWVREMEIDGSAEAKSALSRARLANSGVAAAVVEEPTTEKSDDSWKSLVPDWDDRQQAIETAKSNAIEEAKAQAAVEAEREIESAVAAALAEIEFEAELRREEAIAIARAEAEARAAILLAEELARAEEVRLEAERIHAEELAEQRRLEAEAQAERERVEAEAEAERERIEAENLAEQLRIEAEQLADIERIEAEQFAELEREDRIRAELEAAEHVAAEALAAATYEAELAAAERSAAAEQEEVAQQFELSEEPEPVRASDFATGSFDIIESAEQAATEEFDENNFEILLSDGEIGFAREPKSSLSGVALSSIERRAKSISQLFVWSSISVGIAPLLLAYFALNFEMTIIEKITAIGVGVFISALLLVVVAIGGKRSGLPTLFLSRAAFGVNGNMLAVILQLVVKFVLGAAVLVAVVASLNGNIVGMPDLNQSVVTGTTGFSWLFAIVGLVSILASVLALLGGKVLYWAQLAAAAIAAAATVAYVAVTAGGIQLAASQFEFSGNWFALIGLTTLVATGFGALWVNAVADFTRKIPMGERGKSVATYAALSAGVLPFALVSYALLVSGSLSGQARLSASANPLGALLSSLPDWAASALLVSAAISILASTANWIYSSSVSLSAVSRKLRRFISQPIALVVSLIVGYLFTIVTQETRTQLYGAVFAISGVVVFAWAGIFVADIALRKIAYHEISLTRDYGFYRAVNWVNVAAFIVAIALGLGFVSSAMPGFEWLGYIAKNISAADWAASNIGQFIALGFAALFPILFGRKKIAFQEQEVLKIEARKNDLDHLEFTDAI